VTLEIIETTTITVTQTGVTNDEGPNDPAVRHDVELAAAAPSGGMLDLFPAIEVARRTFSNGSGSTAEVTVAADGSGSLQATGLVGQASMQVSNPDPNARIDFAMQWTCQQGK
jgi:hypothetical protein